MTLPIGDRQNVGQFRAARAVLQTKTEVVSLKITENRANIVSLVRYFLVSMLHQIRYLSYER